MGKLSKWNLFVILTAVGLTVAAFTLAFTGPSQIPTEGDTALWRLSGTDTYYTAGNVGIGTSTPAYKLDVESGDIYASAAARAATSLCIGADCWTQWQDIPSNAVMFFATSTCPSGWTEFTAARGRYLVGLPLGGTASGTVGTALSNQENRPVGQHTHATNDPAHTHSGDTDVQGSGSDVAGGHYFIGTAGGVSYTGIYIDPAGAVAGTNAPYIQYLVCQKD